MNMNLLFSQFLHFDPYYADYYKVYYKKLQDGKVLLKDDEKDNSKNMHMLSLPSVFKSLPKEIQ
jgi:hypothetical protein